MTTLATTRTLLSVSQFSLGLWLATWAACVASLASGLEIAEWQLIVGLACGVLLALDRRRSRRGNVVIVGLCLLLMVCAVALAVAIPDLSWDANLYHYPASFALADGWNPILQHDVSIPDFAAAPGASEFVRCYPKAAWMFSASIYSHVQSIDAGQALGWLLLPAPLGPTYLFMRVLLRCSKRTAVVGSLVVAANPVALYQLTTGYIDGCVASLLPAVLFSAITAIYKPHRAALLIAAVGSSLLIGLKFTGLVYVLVIWFFAAAGLMAGRRRLFSRPLAVGALAIVLGLSLSADSYLANLRTHGNPFYPAWQSAGSTIDAHMSARFRDCNRLEKLVRSLGSRPVRSDLAANMLPVPRVPFTDLHWTYTYESRFSGFGPLFWESLLLALLLVWRRWTGPPALVVLAVLVTAFSTEAAWWARLAPQIWLIPVLCIFRRTHPRQQSRWRRLVSGTVISLLLINVGIVSVISLRESTKNSAWFYGHVISERADDGFLLNDGLQRSVRRRIREARESPAAVRLRASAPPSFDLGPIDRLAIGFGGATQRR